MQVSQPALDYMINAKAPEGFHKPIDTKWVLVGDKHSGPIEFEFFTAGVGGFARALAHAGDGGDARSEIEGGVQPEDFSREEEARGVREGSPGPDAAGQGEAGSQATGCARKLAEGATTTPPSPRPKRSVTTVTTLSAPTVGGGYGVKEPRSRVAVCKPDFIDRVGFGDANGVRFSVDGVITSVVPGGGDALATRSCSLLAAEIGPGLHRLRVEPLREGEPYVAISHIIYPA